MNQEPDFTNKEIELVYHFAQQINENYRVDNDTFNGVVKLFGYEGAVELVVLCGYYTLIGMTLNAFGIVPPAGEEPFSS